MKKFSKFELNFSPFGFIKFTKAASKFKQMSANSAVHIKKARVWPPAYKFNG